MMAYLKTSDISRAVGVHPNTVRLYEDWGYLAPVPRDPRNGYRRYTPAHLDQMRVARLTIRVMWLGGSIRSTALDVIHCMVAGDVCAAAEKARQLRALIQTERARADEAVAVLEQWARGDWAVPEAEPLLPAAVMRLLDVTYDMLRHWERNGLIDVPRDPHSGYRQYGPTEINRLRVIRTLRRAGYSTMAILRMLLHLDRGRIEGLRDLLDTPDPNEDSLGYATDRWLSTLAELDEVAGQLVALVEGICAE